MTKAQAMKYVKSCAATILREEIVNGSGWIYEDFESAEENNDRDPKDVERIKEAISTLANRLDGLR